MKKKSHYVKQHKAVPFLKTKQKKKKASFFCPMDHNLQLEAYGNSASILQTVISLFFFFKEQTMGKPADSPEAGRIYG